MEGTDDRQNTKIRRSRILAFGELLFRDTLGHLYFPCSLQVDATFFRRLRLPSSRRNTPKTTPIHPRPVRPRLSPTPFPASHASFPAANPRPLLNRHAHAAT
jgi:hypothetical protein